MVSSLGVSLFLRKVLCFGECEVLCAEAFDLKGTQAQVTEKSVQGSRLWRMWVSLEPLSPAAPRAHMTELGEILGIWGCLGQRPIEKSSFLAEGKRMSWNGG